MLEGKWHQEDHLIHIINIYSPCDIQNKRVLWNNVQQLKSQSQRGLWCILGDFNNIRHPSERLSAYHRELGESNINEFNEWIDELEVDDAPWLGRKFTWVRPNGTVRSKLDRFMLSSEWLAKWPGSTQQALDRNFSDHCPILLSSKIVDWGPKPFRILDCWLSDKSFSKMVQDSWNSTQQSGWGGFVLKEKIKKLKQSMKVWNTQHFGDTFKKFKKIEEELNKMENDTCHRHLTPEESLVRKRLQEELWIAAQSHESLLRQKARSRWIREGDCDSRYFHLLMNASRRNSCLKGVMIDGLWIEEPVRVKEAVRSFFMQRFQEPVSDRPRLDGISFQIIDRLHNDMLVERFKEEEVKVAMWECGSEKCPGPDGLNFKFIKKYWNLIKPDVLRFLDEFYVNGKFPRGCNASFIALIPKVHEPQCLNEYRPISLIGCIYKIVAKLLANRLKKVMPFIIDERQSAFIEGRHLLHSVVIANEVVEDARRGQKSCIVFKVDYEKAYDSVSWDFLLYLLRRMGFHSKWIR